MKKAPGRMLAQVLSSLWKKPATVFYPFVKPAGMPEKFRGKIVFESEKCIGCLACVRDCPSGAIAIKKVGDKVFEAEFDLSKCIYCAQCVDSCPKKALHFTGEFELAQLHRNNLKVVFHAKAQSHPQK